MPRGGKRKGSGRKSTWESGCKFEDTRTIRIPKAIADEVLDIAHRLDRGESLDLDTKSTEQLNLLRETVLKINQNTRISGTKLALRLGVSSGAITNWVREGTLAQKTKAKDPDNIPWEREGRKYRPLID